MIRVLRGGGVQTHSSHARNLRSGRLKASAGIVLVIFTIVDIMGLVSQNGNSIDWGHVVGIPLPNPFFWGLFAIIGFKLFASGRSKMTSDELTDSTDMMDGVSVFEMAHQEDLFKQPMVDVFGGKSANKAVNKFRTVGEMRRSMDLDKFEDEFERALAEDEMGGSVGRTCHYCSGAGCEQCDNTGAL